MRRIHFQPLALLALFLGLVGPARADQMGVTDSLAAANAESRYGGDGAGTVGFQLSGTWSATITFEATINGVTWTSVYAYNRASGTGATTATSNGTYVVSTAGVRYVRARVSAYTSGTVAVTGLLSPEQSVMDGGASGGGGAGDASAANQTSGDQLTQIVDSTGSKVGVTDHALQVNCANCSGSGVSATDSSTFTNASTAFATTGGFYQSTQTANPLASGRQGAAQVTRYRAVHVNMRDSSGAP
ncbi:MAG TPA: hypothetical protein VK465_05695, partial [Fibrobacteria bacterium]|nr:hypothetical protein [Fibrobacteria bacterium]